MRIALLLVLSLLALGCVSNEMGASPPSGSQSTLQNPFAPPPGQESSPKLAAEIFVGKTYFSTDTVTYSEFSYNPFPSNETHAAITIRFKRVLTTPQYNLIRIMEQVVEAEKRNNQWVVTDTPNARIVSETYEYK